MRCPNCGTENRPQARFCHDCGQRLPVGEPPKPRSNRALRLTMLSALACLMLAVACLGGWWVWQEYGEQWTETPVVEYPPADESEARTEPTPIPTTVEVEVTPEPRNGRIVYAVIHGEDEPSMPIRSLVSVLPDGTFANQITDLPVESQRGIPFSHLDSTRLFSPDERFIHFQMEEYSEDADGRVNFESAGLWLAEITHGKAMLMPKSYEGTQHSFGYHGYFSLDGTLLAYAVEDNPDNHTDPRTLFVRTDTGQIYRELVKTDLLGLLPDGRFILNDMDSGYLSLFNPGIGQTIPIIPMSYRWARVHIMPSGNELIVKMSDAIEYVNIQTGHYKLYRYGDRESWRETLSPSGDRLAVWTIAGYTEDKARYALYDLFVIDIPTAVNRQILFNTPIRPGRVGYNTGMTFSATGKFVIYVRHYGNYHESPEGWGFDNVRYELHAVDIDRSEDHIISKNLGNFTLHPIQDMVVYTEKAEGDYTLSWTGDLFVTTLDGVNKRKIAENVATFQLHPTQERIFYKKVREKVSAGDLPIFEITGPLYTARLEGSDDQLIASQVTTFVFSPDSKSIAYGTLEVVGLDQDGNSTVDTAILSSLSTATVDGQNKSDIVSYGISFQELQAMLEATEDEEAAFRVIKAFYPVAWTEVE